MNEEVLEYGAADKDMKDLKRSNIISHDVVGKQRMLTGTSEEQQIAKVVNGNEVLTEKLMERICQKANLNRAYKQVRKNKGAAGVDGMTVDELSDWIKKHKETFIELLLTGAYKPQEVKKVEIPKPDGGLRQLGIPTVVDRLVQQAIAQVLNDILDKEFSEFSYGFRTGRNAHQALRQAGRYVKEGNDVVIDIDIEKFFDRVNHDILMSKLEKRIKDKRLLRIIRRFLETGMMWQGVVINREEGMPQGGNLSPLLSNLMLDELDKELEKRGHKFCRYADDCNIYVRSKKAGERVMASVKRFLEKRLRLKINENKSKVAMAAECKFLGYNVLNDGRLVIAKESIKRFKDKVVRLTKGNRGESLEAIVKRLNSLLQGWLGYYQLTEYPGQPEALDGWIRRRLRCYVLKQKKRSWTIAKYLMMLGVEARRAWNTAKSSKGWWRLARSPALHQALNKNWFDSINLISLFRRWKMLKV